MVVVPYYLKDDEQKIIYLPLPQKAKRNDMVLLIREYYAAKIHEEWAEPPIMSPINIEVQIRIPVPKGGYTKNDIQKMRDQIIKPSSFDLNYYFEMLVYAMDGIVYYGREQIKNSYVDYSYWDDPGITCVIKKAIQHSLPEVK